MQNTHTKCKTVQIQFSELHILLYETSLITHIMDTLWTITER